MLHTIKMSEHLQEVYVDTMNGLPVEYYGHAEPPQWEINDQQIAFQQVLYFRFHLCW